MAAQLRSSFTGQGFLTSRVTVAPSATAPRQVTCMAKKKGVRMIVTLECTEARAAGATPSRYTTQKVGSSPQAAPRHASWQSGMCSRLAGQCAGRDGCTPRNSARRRKPAASAGGSPVCCWFKCCSDVSHVWNQAWLLQVSVQTAALHWVLYTQHQPC